MTDYAVNEWTRDDLFPRREIVALSRETYERGLSTKAFADDVLDAVVEHLNTHHPKPPRGGHDAQIAQLVRMCNEADLKRTRAECDRDEWKARAEAAEARTAPAVTKADIEQAIRPKFEQWQSQLAAPVDRAIDAVWSLVSGADPAVFVVRESQIAAVKVEQDSHGEWFADGEHVYTYGAEDSRNLAGGYMCKAVRRLAVARTIEAEPADPVEELAGQIESAARTAIRQVCDDLAAVAPSLDPLVVERAMEVTAASRKVAAHVLGQEASDE